MMKVGDNVPVTIAGQTVANAEVREMSDGQAVLIVPATRVVMAVRTELALENPAPVQQDKETIITGVNENEVAPVVQNTETVETVSSETPETPVDNTVVTEGVGADTTQNVETAPPVVETNVNND